jgi:hypothetical protein
LTCQLEIDRNERSKILKDYYKVVDKDKYDAIIKSEAKKPIKSTKNLAKNFKKYDETNDQESENLYYRFHGLRGIYR